MTNAVLSTAIPLFVSGNSQCNFYVCYASLCCLHMSHVTYRITHLAVHTYMHTYIHQGHTALHCTCHLPNLAPSSNSRLPCIHKINKYAQANSKRRYLSSCANSLLSSKSGVCLLYKNRRRGKHDASDVSTLHDLRIHTESAIILAALWSKYHRRMPAEKVMQTSPFTLWSPARQPKTAG